MFRTGRIDRDHNKNESTYVDNSDITQSMVCLLSTTFDRDNRTYFTSAFQPICITEIIAVVGLMIVSYFLLKFVLCF